VKKILGFFAVIGAFIVGLFFKNRKEIEEIFDRQDEEIKSSEDKLDAARSDVEKAKIAAEETNTEVGDLTDKEVEEYWKKKLQ
jgi:hypothetical protein